jgi:hypothetical protein
VPPHVRRQLAARGLLRRHEPRGHVRLTVDRGRVEVIRGGVADVDEDRVVLGRPAPSRARAVVVGPDELVQKAVATEKLVEQQPAVVGLAVVDVEVQRARAREQPAGFGQAGCEKREIVLERVAIRGLVQQARLVATALKPGAIAVGVGVGVQRLAGLDVAGVERRVDVDQLKRGVSELWQQVEVVAEQDRVGAGVARNLWHRRPRLDSNQRPAD